MNNEGMFYTNVDDYETKEDMMNDFIRLRMYDMAKDKEIESLKTIIKEARELIDNFDVFKEFTFPLMKRWEEEQVKSSINYEWNNSIKKPVLEILDKVGENNE